MASKLTNVGKEKFWLEREDALFCTWCNCAFYTCRNLFLTKLFRFWCSLVKVLQLCVLMAHKLSLYWIARLSDDSLPSRSSHWLFLFRWCCVKPPCFNNAQFCCWRLSYFNCHKIVWSKFIFWLDTGSLAHASCFPMCERKVHKMHYVYRVDVAMVQWFARNSCSFVFIWNIRCFYTFAHCVWGMTYLKSQRPFLVQVSLWNLILCL